MGIGAWLADRGATTEVMPPPPVQAQPVQVSPEEQRLVLARELLEKGELDGAQALLQPAPAGIAADGLRQTIERQKSLLAKAEQLQQGEDCPAAIAIWREALRVNPNLRAAKAGLDECASAPAAPKKAAKPAREGGYHVTLF